MSNKYCDHHSPEKPPQTSVVPEAELVPPPFHIAPHHASTSISTPLYPTHTPPHFHSCFPQALLCFQRQRSVFFIFIIFGARHHVWDVEGVNKCVWGWGAGGENILDLVLP